ncbi:hypothetical protein [Haloarchaeobius sp. DFWS5]|uniref:hypothetical protein n=1 Tax=Haloarchaeobius sp. DFWS5 TaxID=3446114 RepID=UPI003EBCB9CA
MTGDLLVLGIESCGHDAWLAGDFIGGTVCPFTEAMGATWLILMAFGMFSMLAVYTRQVTLPAVVTVIVAGMVSSYLPALGARLSMQLAVAVSGTLLFLLYMRVR